MTLVSQAEFARMSGKSAKTISKWKQAGKLVLHGGQVDVEGSRAMLDKYRKGGAPIVTLGVTVPVTQAEQGNDVGNEPGTKRRKKPLIEVAQEQIEVHPGETIDDAAERLVTEINVDMSMDEARRLKEVYLVLLHRLDFEQKSGSLVDLLTAKTVLFEEFRSQRDAWLNWPARIGPMVAAELKVDADKVVEILAAHVHKHITQLGEPQAEFNEASS